MVRLPVDDHPVLHVFAEQDVAFAGKRGCDDHGVVGREAVALDEAQAEVVDRRGDRHDLDDKPDLIEQKPDLRHRKPMLLARHIGEFVQNLNADMAALGGEIVDPIGFYDIRRDEIEQRIGVKEGARWLTGHSPRPDRT